MELEEKPVSEKKNILSSILHFLWLFCLGWSILFLALSGIGKGAGLELRAWFENLSLLILIFALPAAGGARGIGKLFEKMGRGEGKKRPRKIFVILLLLVFVLYLAAAVTAVCLRGENYFEKETKISSHVILVTKKSLLGTAAGGAYYRPTAFFFMQKYAYDDARVVQAVLEQRYEEAFTIGDARNVNAFERKKGSAKLCSAVPEGNGEIVFHVLISYAYIIPYYTDDYAVVRQNRRGMEYLQRYWPEQEIMTDGKDASGLEQALTLVCRSKTDGEELAECMAGMIAYVMEDSFFENNAGTFRISYADDAGTLGYTEFPFGEIWDREGSFTFYANSQNVKNKMESWISDWEEQEKEEEEAEEPEVWEAPLKDEQGSLTEEGAYEKLYEAVFEPEGYNSETTYNAKGNFYAILTKEDDAAGQSAYRTVVYNRESANGKCHIFVYYNESGGNTRIMDFYAVDKETGRVTAGNKKAWDQVASKEYQEAAGEK